MNRLQHIQERLTPLKAVLLDHPIYQEIDRLEALRLFMEHHAFAVWDFMSLLKALQRRLCCIEVPWLPAADPIASRHVNEIVLAEESDQDGRGGFASHFELYHRAMACCGANTIPIDDFLNEIHQGKPIAAALESPGIPGCARQFVRGTFNIIEGGNICAIASAFTFGREDLLPAVFQRIVDELNVEEAGGGLEDFKYNLERHIGLDGEEHGPMANRLLLALCGSDESRWQIAEQAAVACLESRQSLWNGICDAIRRKKIPEFAFEDDDQLSSGVCRVMQIVGTNHCPVEHEPFVAMFLPSPESNVKMFARQHFLGILHESAQTGLLPANQHVGLVPLLRGLLDAFVGVVHQRLQRLSIGCTLWHSPFFQSDLLGDGNFLLVGHGR